MRLLLYLQDQGSLAEAAEKQFKDYQVNRSRDEVMAELRAVAKAKDRSVSHSRKIVLQYIATCQAVANGSAPGLPTCAQRVHPSVSLVMVLCPWIWAKVR